MIETEILTAAVYEFLLSSHHRRSTGYTYHTLL